MVEVCTQDHPTAWIAKRNLARALERHRREPEALPLYRDIYPRFLERFGAEHGYTQRVAFNSAVCMINARLDGHDTEADLELLPGPHAVREAFLDAGKAAMRSEGAPTTAPATRPSPPAPVP